MAVTGNEAQVRMIAEQVAEAAVQDVLFKHPEFRKADIPAPLRWAGGIVASLFTMGIGALAVWLVMTVSDMQVTLARMDERMLSQNTSQSGQFQMLDERVKRLETFHTATGAK